MTVIIREGHSDDLTGVKPFVCRTVEILPGPNVMGEGRQDAPVR